LPKCSSPAKGENKHGRCHSRVRPSYGGDVRYSGNELESFRAGNEEVAGLKKIRHRVPVIIGPEMTVEIENIDDDGDQAGLALTIKINEIWHVLEWLWDSSGENIRDVQSMTPQEMSAFIHESKETALRNGCQFIDPVEDLKEKLELLTQS